MMAGWLEELPGSEIAYAMFIFVMWDSEIKPAELSERAFNSDIEQDILLQKLSVSLHCLGSRLSDLTFSAV